MYRIHHTRPPNTPTPLTSLKPYPLIPPNPYATPTSLWALPPQTVYSPLHLPLNPYPHTHTLFPKFFNSLAVLLISLIPIICISIAIILLFYSVFHSSSILFHAHSNYFFFILFSVEITHPLVRGAHSLMRRATSEAADAGAPVTYNTGGWESLLEGQWGGPCHCQAPGHLEYCQRNRELAEQWHPKLIKHKEMRKNAWP